MPSDSVSVCKTRIRIDYEFVGVQPVGSPDIVLVGFEPESVRFRFSFVELARSESGSLPMVCRKPIVETDFRNR